MLDESYKKEIVMVTRLVIVVILSLLVVSSTYADDSDRIDQLEKEIQDLRSRLSDVENFLSNPNNDQEQVTLGDGSESLANWRKLKRGMDPSDVQKILGDPYRVEGGAFTYWHYQNGGRVSFYHEELDKWWEPQ